MNIHARTCVPVVALLLFGVSASQAQDQNQDGRKDNMVVLTNPDAKEVTAYWTPERFKAARPLPLPMASSSPMQPQAEPRSEPRQSERVESSMARAPLVRRLPPSKQLFTPDAAAPQTQDGSTRQNHGGTVATPGAVGTFGAHFTSSRVFPQFSGSGTPFSADRAYPYITVGKLFFSINGSPYVCSASAIQRRIVATAGHCVHSGTASGFHSNWVFVPAFRDGTAPLLSWNWRAAIVTGAWANGGGVVPNAADYAMIEFGDQSVNGATRALGDLTGWLGWQTLSLSANHTSKLGYPCNLDSCQKMQIVTSGAFRNTAPNNVEYGSDAEGGSSGGPWVQNFQLLQTGGGNSSNNGSNRVVGVTSYGYVPRDPKVQGAAIPDSRWVNIFNTLCARASGNCL